MAVNRERFEGVYIIERTTSQIVNLSAGSLVLKHVSPPAHSPPKSGPLFHSLWPEASFWVRLCWCCLFLTLRLAPPPSKSKR